MFKGLMVRGAQATLQNTEAYAVSDICEHGNFLQKLADLFSPLLQTAEDTASESNLTDDDIVRLRQMRLIFNFPRNLALLESNEAHRFAKQMKTSAGVNSPEFRASLFFSTYLQTLANVPQSDVYVDMADAAAVKLKIERLSKTKIGLLHLKYAISLRGLFGKDVAALHTGVFDPLGIFNAH